MALKKNLLSIVQEILSDLDSEDVGSIQDTLEAMQVAQIVETTFYNIISTRDIPEHKELIKLTADSDSEYPTHFTLDDNVKRIEKLWYDASSDASKEYKEVRWCDPLDFISRSDAYRSDYVAVIDKNAGTTIRVGTNKDPEYYTTFDDNNIVMNSYDNTKDSSLQESKVRAYGYVYPIFNKTLDTYVPDLDASMFPYLIAEAKSVAFSVLKGGVDQKIEQAAKRQKSYVQNDMDRILTPNQRPMYGRS